MMEGWKYLAAIKEHIALLELLTLWQRSFTLHLNELTSDVCVCGQLQDQRNSVFIGV